MISLTTDFECGHGKNIEKLGEDRFRLEVDGDKQQGYSGGYCFDLINEGPAAEVTVELREDSKWGGPTGFGVAFPTTTWIKPVGFHRFRPLRGQYPEWIEGGMTLRVPVEQGQRRLYEALCDTLRLETDAPSTHERASIHRPTTLCYQMARRYGIPHAFYELNNGTSGKHAATLRALNVFRRVVNTLLHHTDTGRGVK